jgi:uncharacterized protein (DUF58 family)
VTVAPEVFEKIRRIQYKMEKVVSDIFQGAYKSRFKGQGIEFEEVREYLPGDEVRTIDWKVTARMNTPYIKRFREERELTVMLLVDLSASSDFGTEGHLKRDVMAEIGALLAFSAIKNHDKIGLILFTDRIELYVPPRKGIRHVLRLVREILARKPEGRGTNLKGALTYLGHMMKRTTITFLISDFLAADYYKELKLTALKNDLIGIRVYDEKERVFPDIGLIEMNDLETGKRGLVDTGSKAFQSYMKEEVQRRFVEVEKEFKRVRAPLVDVRLGTDYLKPMQKAFHGKRAAS